MSTSTAGQDFGAHAAALFTKPNNNEDDDRVSDTQSNHGSGIPDLDSVESAAVDPGSEILSQDWNFDLLEQSFAPMQDSGGSPDGSEESSKETKVCLF